MNQTFVKDFKAANGGMRPNFMAVGAYDGMALVYQGAGEDRRRRRAATALLDAMKGHVLGEPARPGLIDPETRDIVQNIYIRKVEKKDGELYNVDRHGEERQGPGQGREVTPMRRAAGARLAARRRPFNTERGVILGPRPEDPGLRPTRVGVFSKRWARQVIENRTGSSGRGPRMTKLWREPPHLPAWLLRRGT